MKKTHEQVQRFAVILEYDGAAFAGFQLQKKEATVQAALEKAVYVRFGEKRRVGASSRTDAGVHAKGQVAVFDLAYGIIPEKLVPALNSTLPKTVRVVKAKRVSRQWEPRRAAKNKTYSYLVYDREILSPLWRGKAWQVLRRLDVPAMRKAAGCLCGTHDFTSFRAAGCVAKDPRRTIKSITIVRQGRLIRFKFTANAFLYHMVRNLAGTLVEVGKGRMSVRNVEKILKAKDRKLAGPTAPAHGLYLDRIAFR